MSNSKPSDIFQAGDLLNNTYRIKDISNLHNLAAPADTGQAVGDPTQNCQIGKILE